MLPPDDARSRAWNASMGATPGPLDLHVDASQIEGELPHQLRGGRLLSNGPGWTLIGGRMAHPFDGHGYVRAFRFESDGSMRLTARFVQTPAYRSEAAAGKLTHRGLGTNVSDHFWQNIGFGREPRNVANTTILRWKGRLLAGWEGGAPYALDPVSLETLGEETFDGAIAGQPTLAHMKEDKATGRLVTCSLKMGRTTTLTFREFDASGALRESRVAEMPSLLFAHDFVITPHWYIVASNPLRMKWGELALAVAGRSTLMNAIASEKEAPGALYLVPRGAPGPIRTVTLPQGAFVIHYGCAFERDGAVHVDACLFHDFEFGAEFGFQGPHQPLDPSVPDERRPQRLYRITVPVEATAGSLRQLAPHGIDFPRIHPDHEGRETPLLFGATRADTDHSDPFDTVIRVDLRAPAAPPQLWTAGEDIFVGEPIFVPATERDDAGHVLVILTDGLRERSTLAVFDATNITAGPVAAVPLPLLPLAFHGCWDPATA